jgi:hypothetical protein
MIKSITVTNYLGDSIKLDLARPELSGFAVMSVTGLGPGKATINTSEISTTDGGMFNSARLPVRNIVISLKYLWRNSIEDSRQRSYKYFPIKKKVTLLIETDNRIVETSGYVETNDPTIFSKDEGSDISIICTDPFFYSAGDDGVTITEFDGVEPLFEFPFSNESVDENQSTKLTTPTIYLDDGTGESSTETSSNSEHLVRERLTLPTDYSGSVEIESNPSGVYYGTHNLIALPGLAQGTFTKGELTITVEGSHFKLSGCAGENGYFDFVTGEFIRNDTVIRYPLSMGTYRLAISGSGTNAGTITLRGPGGANYTNHAYVTKAKQAALFSATGAGSYAPSLYFLASETLDYEGNLILVRGSTSGYDDEDSAITKIVGTGAYTVDGYVWSPSPDDAVIYHYTPDTEWDKLLEMSSVLTVAERSIIYNGDSETGVAITLHATGDVSNIALVNRNADTSGTMRINVDLVEGDDIVISTVRGNKYVRLIRDGVATNILNRLGKNINWFELVRGENIFTYTAESGLANLSVTIENRIVYEGV